MQIMWQVFYEQFITEGGYKNVLLGLRNTLIIAVCGLIIGIVIGTLVAVVIGGNGRPPVEPGGIVFQRTVGVEEDVFAIPGIRRVSGRSFRSMFGHNRTFPSPSPRAARRKRAMRAVGSASSKRPPFRDRASTADEPVALSKCDRRNVPCHALSRYLKNI